MAGHDMLMQYMGSSKSHLGLHRNRCRILASDMVSSRLDMSNSHEPSAPLKTSWCHSISLSLLQLCFIFLNQVRKVIPHTIYATPPNKATHNLDSFDIDAKMLHVQLLRLFW